MSKSQTHRLWRRFTKKIIHKMRFTHIDVNFDVKYEGHQNCSKTLSMQILRGFSHHHMWRQNWRQYVWTSLCQFTFFCELHSSCVWLFDIFLTTWHLFDNLTSFFHIWAMGHMGKGVLLLILKIEMGYNGGWGRWVMGHMVNVVMCWIMCNSLNTAWIFTKILLHKDIDVFYLNILWFFHDGLL